ncbi:MAG: MFS transporter, partial [Ruthenibacterium sp.]
MFSAFFCLFGTFQSRAPAALFLFLYFSVLSYWRFPRAHVTISLISLWRAGCARAKKSEVCFVKLNYKRTVFVGLAFMSICAFWQVYDSVIPLILKDTFGINDTWIGVVMAMDNVLALFMLPLFGKLSDATRTKIGRRMPYILGGTAVALLCLMLMPVAQKSHNLVLLFIGLGL